ncbi:MAG: beta-lactamase family protein [Chitinophagaceae bacterium]|nr:beta-lactamase family protein [Chitinophagaceae bacterium]
MKTLMRLFTVALIGWGCTSSSGNGVTIPKDDSLDYYPPTPVQLDKKVFRHYFREVSRFFETGLLARGFSGGILVAKEGNIIYENYSGYANAKAKDVFTDSTATHIASSGKTFTGMAILRMAQDGLISLNDQLERFFPGFPYPGVSVQMLLCHRSGLPNYVYFMPKEEWKNKQVTNQDVLDYMLTKKPNRSFTPGRRFNYSNTNYVLLALIIEKVSGLSFPDYMKTKYFEPLGMKHTFVYSVKENPDVIVSYKANGAVWDNDHLEGTYGDKNIYTTPRDLLKWDQAFYTDQIISRPLLDSAFTPYSNERPSVHNYGLGWRLLMLSNGKKVIYHNGRWHGFNAAFARLTDEKVTIIVLGNKFNSRIYSDARKSYDIFGDYLQDGDRDEEDTEITESSRKPASLQKSTPAIARK